MCDTLVHSLSHSAKKLILVFFFGDAMQFRRFFLVPDQGLNLGPQQRVES